MVGDSPVVCLENGPSRCFGDAVKVLEHPKNVRYDLVIDDGRSLARIQCTTGRLQEGGVRWKACSSYAHHRNPTIAERDYAREIDYFAVYCPETAGVYLIPIEDASLRAKGTLRVHPPRNNQRRFIRLASDYQIGRVEIAPAATGL
jgi:PD-(D/E)XK endonuclease